MAGGLLYLAGMLIMAYNTFKTVSGGQSVNARIPTIVGAHA
jgi:cytochrome c oxidase cbb3-type subunit 1